MCDCKSAAASRKSSSKTNKAGIPAIQKQGCCVPVRKPPLFKVHCDEEDEPPCMDSACSSVGSGMSLNIIRCANPRLDIEQLKHYISGIVRERYIPIKNSFENYDLHRTGKIQSRYLRVIFEHYCFPLTTDQWNYVLPKCRVDNCGKVYYREFLKELAGWDDEFGYRDFINPEAASTYASIDELIAYLKIGMEKNVRNVLLKFKHADRAHDGFVQKMDFFNILKDTCFRMTNEQFERLWRRFDPDSHGVLNYESFMAKVNVRGLDKFQRFLPRRTVAQTICHPDTLHVRCHAESEYERMRTRANLDIINDPCLSKATFKGLVKNFLERLATHRMEKFLADCCRQYDRNDIGFISCNDLHGILNQHVMPMTDDVFNLIMDCIAPKDRGATMVNWKKMIENYCVDPYRKAHKYSQRCAPYHPHRITFPPL